MLDTSSFHSADDIALLEIMPKQYNRLNERIGAERARITVVLNFREEQATLYFYSDFSFQ